MPLVSIHYNGFMDAPFKIPGGHVRGEIFWLAQLEHSSKPYIVGQLNTYILKQTRCLTRQTWNDIYQFLRLASTFARQ